MPSRESTPPTLGAGNHPALGPPAYSDDVEHPRVVGDGSSSDEEMDAGTTSGQDALETSNLQDQQPAPSSHARHRPGTSSQTNCTICEPRCVGQCFQTGSQVDLQALFEARLKATDEEIKQIDFLVDFIYWISHSNFRRHQQPEPEVGDPSSTVPAAVEGQGIKGQSVYTSLFHHLDMERFTCKLCHHIVEENLEDAITHQRIAHFGHYPYQCLPNHTPCGQRFASQASLEAHQDTDGH